MICWWQAMLTCGNLVNWLVIWWHRQILNIQCILWAIEVQSVAFMVDKFKVTNDLYCSKFQSVFLDLLQFKETSSAIFLLKSKLRNEFVSACNNPQTRPLLAIVILWLSNWLQPSSVISLWANQSTHLIRMTINPASRKIIEIKYWSVAITKQICYYLLFIVSNSLPIHFKRLIIILLRIYLLCSCKLLDRVQSKLFFFFNLLICQCCLCCHSSSVFIVYKIVLLVYIRFIIGD